MNKFKKLVAIEPVSLIPQAEECKSHYKDTLYFESKKIGNNRR